MKYTTYFMASMMLASATFQALAQTKYGDPISSEATNPKASVGDVNSTGCGYPINETDRIKLMKEGFTFSDSNNLGYNFFSKMTYVYPDKMYAQVKGEVWRIVYLGLPAVYKEYVGKNFTCSFAYGYPVNGGGGQLTFVQTGTITFLENYSPPKSK